MKRIFSTMAIFISFTSFSYEFERDIHEVQVLSDRVRINLGITYGTCGDNEGWWGWMLTQPASSQWLSVVLSAQAQNKKVTVFDAHGSCGGIIKDAVGLEGIYLKK